MREVKQFGVIPIAYDTLVHIYAHYKSPKDKIANLVKDGALIRLKRGLYVVASAISEQKLLKELVANHLYGSSYVSLKTALSYYGMIPERVHLTRSITTKRAKRFSTPIGSFDFLTMPESWFSIGLRFE
jgi:predicted transcriptional regulator of viral defense system